MEEDKDQTKDTKVILVSNVGRKPEDDLHVQWKETDKTWTDFLKGLKERKVTISPYDLRLESCLVCGRFRGQCICEFTWPVPKSLPLQTGWTCTKCGRSLSPFTSECPCSTPPLIVTC
jgi:hypothetical protein